MAVALTRLPAPTLAECELTYREAEPIDLELARAQHAAYRAALAAARVEVVVLPEAPAYPDSVFVEDVAVVLDEVAVLTQPGASSRRGEVGLIETALACFRPVVSVASNGDPSPSLDGGDVLRLGRTLYVGHSPRTNPAGIDALRACLAPYGYAVCPVAVSGCLHLKTGLTALDETTLLANPAWVDLSPLAGFDLIAVSPDEPWAANVLRVGQTLLASAAYPRTLDRLARRNLDLVPLDISEFAKAEAGLTCLSLLVA
jgi:dimethylargininase